MKTYLMYDGNYFKIGRSNNIKKRHQTIKANNPNVILIGYSDIDIEYHLHVKYNKFCYHNEWFLIKDNNIINNLINEFEFIVNNLEDFETLKSLHTNTIAKKESMGGKIGSKIKQNKSIKLIQDAIDECAKQNITPTRKRIAEMTGLGIATVKRNWNKEVNDINNIEVPLESKYEDIKEERDYKLKQLTEIEEDLFWENWQPKKVSQDKDEIVDKDWGESDGIPGFIETI